MDTGAFSVPDQPFLIDVKDQIPQRPVILDDDNDTPDLSLPLGRTASDLGKRKEKPRWSCLVCTYANRQKAKRCKICLTPRGQHNSPANHQHQLSENVQHPPGTSHRQGGSSQSNNQRQRKRQRQKPLPLVNNHSVASDMGPRREHRRRSASNGNHRRDPYNTQYQAPQLAMTASNRSNRSNSSSHRRAQTEQTAMHRSHSNSSRRRKVKPKPKSKRRRQHVHYEYNEHNGYNEYSDASPLSIHSAVEQYQRNGQSQNSPNSQFDPYGGGGGRGRSDPNLVDTHPHVHYNDTGNHLLSPQSVHHNGSNGHHHNGHHQGQYPQPKAKRRRPASARHRSPQTPLEHTISAPTFTALAAPRSVPSENGYIPPVPSKPPPTAPPPRNTSKSMHSKRQKKTKPPKSARKNARNRAQTSPEFQPGHRPLPSPPDMQLRNGRHPGNRRRQNQVMELVSSQSFNPQNQKHHQRPAPPPRSERSARSGSAQKRRRRTNSNGDRPRNHHNGDHNGHHNGHHHHHRNGYSEPKQIRSDQVPPSMYISTSSPHQGYELAPPQSVTTPARAMRSNSESPNGQRRDMIQLNYNQDGRPHTATSHRIPHHSASDPNLNRKHTAHHRGGRRHSQQGAFTYSQANVPYKMNEFPGGIMVPLEQQSSGGSGYRSPSGSLRRAFRDGVARKLHAEYAPNSNSPYPEDPQGRFPGDYREDHMVYDSKSDIDDRELHELDHVQNHFQNAQNRNVTHRSQHGTVYLGRNADEYYRYESSPIPPVIERIEDPDDGRRGTVIRHASPPPINQEDEEYSEDDDDYDSENGRTGVDPLDDEKSISVSVGLANFSRKLNKQPRRETESYYRLPIPIESEVNDHHNDHHNDYHNDHSIPSMPSSATRLTTPIPSSSAIPINNAMNGVVHNGVHNGAHNGVHTNLSRTSSYNEKSQMSVSANTNRMLFSELTRFMQQPPMYQYPMQYHHNLPPMMVSPRNLGQLGTKQTHQRFQSLKNLEIHRLSLQRTEESRQKHESKLLEILKFDGDEYVDTVTDAICNARVDVLCHFLPLIAFVLCQSDKVEWRNKLILKMKHRQHANDQADLKQSVRYFVKSYNNRAVQAVFSGLVDDNNNNNSNSHRNGDVMMDGNYGSNGATGSSTGNISNILGTSPKKLKSASSPNSKNGNLLPKDIIGFWLKLVNMNLKEDEEVKVPYDLKLMDPVNQLGPPLRTIKVKKVINSNSKPLLVETYSRDANERLFLSSTFILKQGDDLRKDKSCMLVFKWINHMFMSWGADNLKYGDALVKILTLSAWVLYLTLYFVECVYAMFLKESAGNVQQTWILVHSDVV